MERIRALVDHYEGRFTVAEVGGEGAEAVINSIPRAVRAFIPPTASIDLYAESLTPQLVRDSLSAWPERAGIGWPSWAFSNHDAPRAVSRWFAPADREAGARLSILLLVCLRGNIFLYQGEELGLPQAHIAFADLQDPEAIANWPQTLGRDGARTPMPWNRALPGAGFTTGIPWLVIGEGHAALAVAEQARDPDSQLTLTRRLIALRQRKPALRTGSLNFLDAPDNILAFERTAPGERLLCVFNLGRRPSAWQPPQPARWELLDRVGAADRGNLPGYSGFIAQSY